MTEPSRDISHKSRQSRLQDVKRRAVSGRYTSEPSMEQIYRDSDCTVLHRMHRSSSEIYLVQTKYYGSVHCCPIHCELMEPGLMTTGITSLWTSPF
jgi:hypothetical protein